MTQHFFNEKYFNLMSNGLTSTTWTWEGLKNISKKNIFKNLVVYPLNYEINTETKFAKEYYDVLDKEETKKIGIKIWKKIYTGKTSQLI